MPFKGGILREDSGAVATFKSVISAEKLDMFGLCCFSESAFSLLLCYPRLLQFTGTLMYQVSPLGSLARGVPPRRSGDLELAQILFDLVVPHLFAFGVEAAGHG